MKKKFALVTILTFLFVMMAGFVPALAEDGVGEWVELERGPSRSSPYDAVAIDGKIYMVYGNNSFAIYDITTNNWEDKTAGTNTISASMAVVNEKIYVMGESGIAYYDIGTDAWTQLTVSGAIGLRGATSSVINGKIYIAGGSSGSYYIAFRVFDPSTNTLKDLEPCLYQNVYGSSVNINDKFYLACGGKNNFSMYDPESNTWTALANCPEDLQYSAAGAINGKMYVSKIGKNFFMYDPVTNQWTRLSDTPANSGQMPIGASWGGKYYHILLDGRTFVYTPEDYTGPTDPTEPATPTNLQILMAKNETVNLTTFLIGTPDPEAMQWASSDTAIATVNENGNVTAVEVGTSVISVQNEDGSFKAAVRVRVMEGGLAPSGDPRLMVMLSTGEKFRLELTGGDDPVTWTSNDEAIVTVATWNSENRIGEVTAVAPGLTYITATDGTQTEQIYVQVR